MKNLQETLKNRINNQRVAWNIYSRCFISHANRLLKHMGEEKDYSIDDLQEALQENFYKNYICKELSKKALVSVAVEKYDYIQFCYRHWLKTVKEVFDIEVEITRSL